MSFVIKEEGLPNLSDRGSRWGTTVCVFINKIGQILSGPGICGTLGSTTYPRTQVCLANPKMSRLNRKYNIMFSSHHLTFGTQKQRFTHMPNKEAHEKANWPVLVLVRLALIKAVAQCELCASEINPNSGKTLLILYKSVENKASTALQQLLGCVFNIPRPNPALPCCSPICTGHCQTAALVQQQGSQKSVSLGGTAQGALSLCWDDSVERPEWEDVQEQPISIRWNQMNSGENKMGVF